MKREPIRVEPISTYLERRRKGPICPVIVAGETVYVSGLPPFDPVTGEVKQLPFVQQTEIVLDQMKLCLEVAGSSLQEVVKCNVYCTPDSSNFDAFNDVYQRYFPVSPPARIFLTVPSWPGEFDVEVDCVAIRSDLEDRPASARDMNELRHLNAGYMRSVALKDVDWFREHLSDDSSTATLTDLWLIVPNSSNRSRSRQPYRIWDTGTSGSASWVIWRLSMHRRLISKPMDRPASDGIPTVGRVAVASGFVLPLTSPGDEH
ncbi:MAG: 2-iminobutanoate/2-iminopropanoate deaminase [Bradyrhizobium sp.]|nr:2-iminobutanoate/2-iminopropanoate deaminase [Bradyrhizobium sp.]